MVLSLRGSFTIFLSTLSLRRATVIQWEGMKSLSISIHALLAESDFIFSLPLVLIFLFLSTLSLRRATTIMLYDTSSLIFLSTLSLRRATVTVLGIQHKVGISIHALLAESDLWVWMGGLSCNISIHALLAESDRLKPRQTRTDTNFYPRSPCGERRLQIFLYYQDNNFYPRSPCGERPPQWKI